MMTTISVSADGSKFNTPADLSAFLRNSRAWPRSAPVRVGELGELFLRGGSGGRAAIIVT